MRFFIKAYQRARLVWILADGLSRWKTERFLIIFPSIQKLAESHGIQIQVGDRACEKTLYRVCEYMAQQLAMALYIEEPDGFHAGLYTNNGKPLPRQPVIQAVPFPGGGGRLYAS